MVLEPASLPALRLLVTKDDEARRIAANIAKLRGLLKKSEIRQMNCALRISGMSAAILAIAE
jgi:hypothetical protein